MTRAGALQIGVADRVGFERLRGEVVSAGFEFDDEVPLRPVGVDLVTGDPDVAERPGQQVGVDELVERGLESGGDVRRFVLEVRQRGREGGDAGCLGLRWMTARKAARSKTRSRWDCSTTWISRGTVTCGWAAWSRQARATLVTDCVFDGDVVRVQGRGAMDANPRSGPLGASLPGNGDVDREQAGVGDLPQRRGGHGSRLGNLPDTASGGRWRSGGPADRVDAPVPMHQAGSDPAIDHALPHAESTQLAARHHRVARRRSAQESGIQRVHLRQLLRFSDTGGATTAAVGRAAG